MRIRTRTELGALLRSERERQKMTQQQLANRIGTSRRWVSAIETGAENPTLDLLLRWLGALSLELSIARPTSWQARSPGLRSMRSSPLPKRNSIMAEKELVVLMNGTLLGHVRQASNGNLELTYDENYRNDPSATPLSTAMPLTGHLYRDRSVRPFLVGLLPDNDDVLARWERPLASLIGILRAPCTRR